MYFLYISDKIGLYIFFIPYNKVVLYTRVKHGVSMKRI